MIENSQIGMCRCMVVNARLLASLTFWWSDVRVYYCDRCDGLSLEIISDNPERKLERSLCDVYSNLPGGKSVIVLDACWMESLAKIVKAFDFDRL